MLYWVWWCSFANCITNYEAQGLHDTHAMIYLSNTSFFLDGLTSTRNPKSPAIRKEIYKLWVFKNAEIDFFLKKKEKNSS